jgi:pyruvate dehydrogenase E1 component alpha subunit
MHIADAEQGNLGANAIVAGGIPIAVGAALASQMRHSGRIAVSFFGDAATNEGAFHEALNLAGIWNLPVVFVCENNGFGISVPQWQSTPIENLSDRAGSYGFPGITVDGNDAEEVYARARDAVSRARAGEGPTLIECKTYRWMGHWTGDPQPYRTREEVEVWRTERCPIAKLGQSLIDAGVPEDILAGLRDQAAIAMREAEDFALGSPLPDPGTVMENVFYDGGTV